MCVYGDIYIFIYTVVSDCGWFRSILWLQWQRLSCVSTSMVISSHQARSDSFWKLSNVNNNSLFTLYNEISFILIITTRIINAQKCLDVWYIGSQWCRAGKHTVNSWVQLFKNFIFFEISQCTTLTEVSHFANKSSQIPYTPCCYSSQIKVGVVCFNVGRCRWWSTEGLFP